MFQNKESIEIIGFWLMHFGFAWDLPDIDLLNTDLLDSNLDLLDTDIPSKHFACLQDVLKTSSRHVFKTFEDVFSVTIFRLPRRLEDVLQEEKLLRWRRAEDIFKTSLEKVFKTS